MQTELQSGPSQEFPAHLIEFARSTASTSPVPLSISNTQSSQTIMAPDAMGTFRGAIYCLPVAMVMWAIIIVAITHFLIR